jgi:hypothetical protein
MTKKWKARTVSMRYQGRPMRGAEEQMTLKERQRLHRLRHPNDKTTKGDE